MVSVVKFCVFCFAMAEKKLSVAKFRRRRIINGSVVLTVIEIARWDVIIIIIIINFNKYS